MRPQAVPVRPIAVVGAGIPDAMASAISNVDIAIWAETSGGPHPECPSVCAREARNRQVWSGILRHAGSRLRLWENVGHDARGETCRPGEREVGAVERTHNFMCSKPLSASEQEVLSGTAQPPVL